MRAVTAVALLLAALHLDAALVAGPERAVAPPTYGPAYGMQYPQDLASDGTDFLSLWIDRTPGRDGLYGAVITDSGATRPLPPRALFRGPVSNAKAVWAGDAYLVVWDNSYGNEIGGARVSRDGELLSPPFTIASHDVRLLALAWNGRNAMVVAYRTATYEAIFFTADGNVLRTETLPSRRTETYRAAAAAAGDTFAAFWQETTFAGGQTLTSVRAMRFGVDGAPLDTTANTVVSDLPNYVEELSVASDGERFGLAFVARPNVFGVSAQLRRFTIDAKTMQVTAHSVRSTPGDQPQVIAAASGFVAGMLTNDGGKSVLELIPFDGLPSELVVADKSGAWLRLAAASRSAMAVWSDYRLSPPNEYSNIHMFGVGLDATATAPTRDVLPVALSAVAQTTPVIAPAGDVALVVWTDLTNTRQGEVKAVRVDRAGAVLDPAPLVLGTGARSIVRPAVVFTGKLWLVACAARQDEQPGLTIKRITLDGVLLPETDTLTGGARALASNGDITVLAMDRFLVRFSRDGVRRDEEPVAATEQGVFVPAIASNGREFLYVWTEGSDYWQFPSANLRDLRAILLDRQGTRIGPVIDLAVSAANERSPVIAANGTDFLVLYQHDDGVRTKRVLREGVVVDGALVAPDSTPLAIASNGAGYVAAVADPPRSGGARMAAIELDAQGAPAAAPVVIASTEAVEIFGDLASSNGMLWSAYVRTAAGPPFENIERVFVRTLHETAVRRRAVR